MPTDQMIIVFLVVIFGLIGARLKWLETRKSKVNKVDYSFKESLRYSSPIVDPNNGVIF